MTVKELIAQLQQQPLDRDVCFELEDPRDCNIAFSAYAAQVYGPQREHDEVTLCLSDCFSHRLDGN